RERPLLALELLGPPPEPARGARRDLGLPRGRERDLLAHDPPLRREPVLSPRRQPLDRDAAGADRDDHRRRVRVPSQAPGRLPGGAELLGARPALADRVGLSAVSRLARALSVADAARVLPAQLLGGRRGERARDRADRGTDRRRPDVRLDGLSPLRLELPARIDESPEERAARDRRADPRGRRAPLRLHRGALQESGRRRCEDRRAALAGRAEPGACEPPARVIARDEAAGRPPAARSGGTRSRPARLPAWRRPT